MVGCPNVMKARELQHDGDDGWGSFLKLPPANDPRLELDHAILSYLTQKGALVIPPLLKRGVTKMQVFQVRSAPFALRLAPCALRLAPDHHKERERLWHVGRLNSSFISRLSA